MWEKHSCRDVRIPVLIPLRIWKETNGPVGTVESFPFGVLGATDSLNEFGNTFPLLG